MNGLDLMKGRRLGPKNFFFLLDGGQLTDLALRLGLLYLWFPSLAAQSSMQTELFSKVHGSSMTSGTKSGFPYNVQTYPDGLENSWHSILETSFVMTSWYLEELV